MHSYICQTYLVQWCCIDLWLIRGGGGVSLPWVYVHSAIYETCAVLWCLHKSMVNKRRGTVCHGYMCILL